MWLWCTAAFLAFFIKGLCGFANTLVFTSILSFGTVNINISPVELLLGYPANMVLTWRNRARLDRKILVPLMALILLGSIPGAFLLKFSEPGSVKIILGIVIIVIGLEMLLRDRGILKYRESKLILGIIGILSGILCGLFGIGALLAAYVGRVTEDTAAFKANISAVFIVENSFRILLYLVLGILTLSSLRNFLMLSPFMILGLFAGIKSSRVLNEQKAKLLIVILLMISGAMMIINNLPVTALSS